jgi:hypothetical protein
MRYLYASEWHKTIFTTERGAAQYTGEPQGLEIELIAATLQCLLSENRGIYFVITGTTIPTNRDFQGY